MLRIFFQAVLSTLILVCQAEAWVPAAPDEAIFFEDAACKGASLTVQLQAGRRHRLMPGLAGLHKKISAIIVGKNVKVMVFTNPDFEGAVREYRDTITEGMPDDDQIASLIVCPREEQPQGVLFIQKRTSEIKKVPRPWHYITGKGIFFPLPESEDESEAKFPAIARDWDDQAKYVNISPTVQVELFADPEFRGRSLSLPLPGSGPQAFFDLTASGFYDPKKTPPGVISSLKVRTRETSNKSF